MGLIAIPDADIVDRTRDTAVDASALPTEVTAQSFGTLTDFS